MKVSILRIFAAFLAVSFLICSGAAQAQEKPRLLVLSLKPAGVDEKITQSLSSILAMEVERLDRFEIVSQDEIIKVLSVEEQKQLMGAEEDDERVAKIGESLRTPYLLSGSLGKVGSTFIISLSLINTKTLKAERRVKQTLIGKRDELIGALRSAAVALALEEKGVAPDITEKLLGELHMAEKEKTMFFHLRPGFEIPIGEMKNDATIPYLVTDFFHIDVDAAYQPLSWLQVGLSTGFAFSLAGKYDAQTKHAMVHYEEVYTNSEGNPVENQTFRTDVNITDFDYFAYRIPIDIFVRFQPKSGLFLPYFMTGLGISYNAYNFENARLQTSRGGFMLEPDVGCEATTFSISDTSDTYGNICRQKNENLTILQPDSSSLSYFGFDFIAGTGFDYLLHENLGISLELRYLMIYSFKDENELEMEFVGENALAKENYGDFYPVRQVHHGLLFNMGMTMYF